MLYTIETKRDVLNVISDLGAFTVTHMCDDCETPLETHITIDNDTLNTFKQTNRFNVGISCDCGEDIKSIHVTSITAITSITTATDTSDDVFKLEPEPEYG